MNEKTYIPKCSAKLLGESLLKLSFKAKDLVDFIHQNTNDRGYFNICVSPRRETGQFGDTHSVWLDTWKPDPSKRSAPPAAQSQPINNSDDVPF